MTHRDVLHRPSLAAEDGDIGVGQRVRALSRGRSRAFELVTTKGAEAVEAADEMDGVERGDESDDDKSDEGVVIDEDEGGLA